MLSQGMHCSRNSQNLTTCLSAYTCILLSTGGIVCSVCHSSGRGMWPCVHSLAKHRYCVYLTVEVNVLIVIIVLWIPNSCMIIMSTYTTWSVLRCSLNVKLARSYSLIIHQVEICEGQKQANVHGYANDPNGITVHWLRCPLQTLSADTNRTTRLLGDICSCMRSHDQLIYQLSSTLQ